QGPPSSAPTAPRSMTWESGTHGPAASTGPPKDVGKDSSGAFHGGVHPKRLGLLNSGVRQDSKEPERMPSESNLSAVPTAPAIQLGRTLAIAPAADPAPDHPRVSRASSAEWRQTSPIPPTGPKASRPGSSSSATSLYNRPPPTSPHSTFASLGNVPPNVPTA